VALFWRYRSAIGPQNVALLVALVLQAWRYDRATIHTGKRGIGATVALLFILGECRPVALAPLAL